MIDFGLRSDDYARFRPGFPGSFYDRIERFLPLAGAHVLDVGTGPGTVALELARRGSTVVGLDIAANQIRAARERAEQQGLAEHCRFLVGVAEELPGVLPPEVLPFDLVCACQCWWWFDGPAVKAGIAQGLRPGGLLVVASYNYLPRRCPVAAATEELILEMVPTWDKAGMTGISPDWIDELSADRLELIEQFCYDHHQPFTHEEWRGRIRTCNGVGSGAMSPEQVEMFDARLADLLRTRFPGQPMLLPHRIWAVVVRKPPAEPAAGRIL